MTTNKTARSASRRPSRSPILALARQVSANQAAIEKLDLDSDITRQLIRTAADDSRRHILAEKPANTSDVVLQLRELLGFTYARISGQVSRVEMGEDEADFIIAGLNDVIDSIAAQNGVPKSIATMHL